MKFPITALTLFVSLLFQTDAISQERKAFSENCFWIMGQQSGIVRATSSATTDSVHNRYLNYNAGINLQLDKISRKYKNLIGRGGSLFVVFQSSSKDESILLLMERGSLKTSLSNRKVASGKEILLNKGNCKTGMQLSYLYNKNSLSGRKNGSLSFDEGLYGGEAGNDRLFELVYVPRFVAEREQKIIESYLSIKYGISLQAGEDYYNSKGDKIWEAKKSTEYSNRITGIGRDSGLGLNQKQSKNSLMDGLSIGLGEIKTANAENESVIGERSFLIWGDNGHDILLEKSMGGTQKKMRRIWKLKTISDSVGKYKTQIKIDKSLMRLDSREIDKDFYWLAIDSSNAAEFNYHNSRYIQATVSNKDEIVFDRVEFSPNSEYLFTIVKDRRNAYSKSTENTNTAQILGGNDKNDDFRIYPNPSLSSEKFTVEFNLNEVAAVSVKITDMGGRILKNTDIGPADNYFYRDSLTVSGTYLVVVTINGISETRKLIIK